MTEVIIMLIFVGLVFGFYITNATKINDVTGKIKKLIDDASKDK